MAKLKIGGIMQSANLAKIGIMSVPERPGVAGATLSALGHAGVNVHFVVQFIELNDHTQIVCCIANEDG